MSKTNTYIELNGTRYDARSGQVIEPSISTVTPSRGSVSSAQAMDGVVRRSHHSETVSATSRAPAHHQKARSAKRHTQRSHTLMRQAVRKPSGSKLLHAKATPLTTITEKATTDHHQSAVNPDRHSRAQAITKSALVSKFGTAKLAVKLAHLPVTQAPKTKPTPARLKAPTTVNPFEKMLDRANSHQQPKLKKPRWHHRAARKLHISPRALNIGAGALAALLIGGFILYQNIPNLMVRVAAARAGFHASLPSYHPAGFSLKGPIHYAAGELTVNFQSNSDQRNFQVKQQSSSWNSETLLQAYVAKQNQPYQTYEDGGRTVYIDNHGANLVTGNKWIQVQSDGSLSTDQLLNIVKSIN